MKSRKGKGESLEVFHLHPNSETEELGERKKKELRAK